MVPSRCAQRLNWRAAACNRSTSAAVRYSRVKLDEHEIKRIVGDLSPIEQSPDRSRVDGYLLPATSKPIRNRAARMPMMIGDESLGYEVPMTW